jgi:DnaK suppressor protein
MNKHPQTDLEIFAKIIETKLAQTRETIRETQQAITEHSPTLNSNVWSDEANTEIDEMETLIHTLQRAKAFESNLIRAQLRLKNQTYGICHLTGELIPKERLCAHPTATTTLAAKIKAKEEIENVVKTKPE